MDGLDEAGLEIADESSPAPAKTGELTRYTGHFGQRDLQLSRSRLGGSLKLHLELAADCVRNQGRRSVTLFVYTTRTLTEEATWIR